MAPPASRAALAAGLLLAAGASRARAARDIPGAAPQPWQPLHGGAFSGPPAPLSPDLLVSYVWPLSGGGVDDSQLQVIAVQAQGCGPHGAGTPPGSFSGAASCGSGAVAVTVSGNGTLIVDFGVEVAGWFEFDSADLQPADVGGIVVGIGEYTEVDYVGGFKQDNPKVYGTACGGGGAACTYRLETSPVGPELYEGVRYGFITLRSAPSKPFTITALRAVAQAKPMNYVGAFSSAGDPLLERVWYTAAYTVRVCAQSDYMGSILMNRGDRFSWTGDAHPAQATSMAAFGNFPFVLNNLNRSKADCQGIATYCLYFVLSVSDYYAATGDAAAVAYLTPNVVDHLNQAVGQWANPEGLRFVGWDDRTGSGFCNNTTPETQNLYRLLAIRAFSAAGSFFAASGNSALGTLYTSYAANFTAKIRAMGGGPSWYSSFGLHASADAVNAGFLTPDEMAGVAAGALSDIVKAPSQSQFNSYFILQALGTLGQMDRATEYVRVTWGSISEAGASTYWETSHPSFASLQAPGPSAPFAEQSGWVSYAHPWASGPCHWLSKWVAGIRPLEPGFGRTLIAPHVAHSMAGVAGRLGTPHGVVSVNATRGAGGRAAARIELELPAGVREAVLRLSAVTLDMGELRGGPREWAREAGEDLLRAAVQGLFEARRRGQTREERGHLASSRRR